MNYKIQNGTVLESFGTAGDWTVISGSVRTTPLGLEVTAASGSNGIATKTISSVTPKLGAAVLEVNIANATDLANISSIEVFISSSATFASYFHVSFRGGGSASNGGFSSDLHEGVNKLLISRGSWDVTGGEDWGNTMVRIRVRVNSATGVIGIATFSSLSFGEYSRPKCVLIFDDGRLTIYQNAYPILKRLGLPATVAANSGLLNFTGTYMSLAMYNEVFQSGWEIVNHTDTHIHCDLETLDTIRTEVTLCDNWLKQNGFVRNGSEKIFIYPYGGYNDSSVDLLKSMGYKFQRSTHGGRDNYSDIDSVLGCWQNFIPSDSLASAKATIDRLIGEGGTMFLSLHSIITGATQNIEWETSSFQSLMEYIASKQSQLDVVTLPEWYRGLASPNKRKIA